MHDMPKIESGGGVPFDKTQFLEELEERGRDISAQLRSMVFQRCVVYFHREEGDAGEAAEVERLARYVRYGGGTCVDGLESEGLTQVVLVGDSKEVADTLRRELSTRAKLPRLVSGSWVETCWKEKSVVDEETVQRISTYFSNVCIYE